MSKSVILGRRRFTCLTDGLVRMEYSPTGKFEDRRSLVAAGQSKAIAFKSVERNKDWTVLDTGRMEVWSRHHEKDFYKSSLKVVWKDGDVPQYWQPGDVDYANLGSLVHSYDRFNQYATLEGVHPADMQPLDARANTWLCFMLSTTLPRFYRQMGDWPGGEKVMHCNPYAAAKFGMEAVPHRLKNQTLDHLRYAPGILSRSGYCFLNDSESAVLGEEDFPVERGTPGTKDWYFFVYGRDYVKGLRDFILLSGRAPLPPRQVFGVWMSRWPAFTEEESREIYNRFAGDGVKLGVLVIDMEWHKQGWCNWDVDPQWSKDLRKFCDWVHGRGMLVTLNVHPQRIQSNDSHWEPFFKQVEADQHRLRSAKEAATHWSSGSWEKDYDIDLARREEARAFMDILHDPLREMGCDFWWLDGMAGEMDGSSTQLLSNHVYFNHVDQPGKRPMLLSRYGGVGSHRYGVLFTADSHSEWHTLKTQCEYNIRAGQIGTAYVSHDIGGFMAMNAPLIDPGLYIRWVQAAVFGPVFRFHSAPGCGSRMPWDYGKQIHEAVMGYLKLRNSLLPYVYGMARKHYEEGLPLVRGMYLHWPNEEAAYRYDQYMFGDQILVAPLIEPGDYRKVWLPRGQWYHFLDGQPVESRGEEVMMKYSAVQMPVFVQGGALIVKQGEEVGPEAGFVKELVLDCFPQGRGRAVLYEDDGRSGNYLHNQGTGTTVYTLQASKQKMMVRSQAIQGTSLGKQRNVILRVPVEKAIKEVKFNGKKVKPSQITQEEKTCWYRIELGQQKVDRPWQAQIQW